MREFQPQNLAPESLARATKKFAAPPPESQVLGKT
jgi:hypothetical protein